MQTQLAGPRSPAGLRKKGSRPLGWAADWLGSRAPQSRGSRRSVGRSHAAWGQFKGEVAGRRGAGGRCLVGVDPVQPNTHEKQKGRWDIIMARAHVLGPAALDSKPGLATYKLCDLGQDIESSLGLPPL